MNALNALHGKAFSERSEDFSAAGRRESNDIFRLAGKSLDFFDSLSRGGEIRPGFLSSAWKDGEQTMRHTLELTPRLRTAADLVPAGARKMAPPFLGLPVVTLDAFAMACLLSYQ